MIKLCRRISENEQFQTFVLFLILLLAGTMGFETVPAMAARYGELFEVIHWIAQIVFVFEIAVRLVAYSPRFKNFFKDAWNSFDFAIVVLSFCPGVGSFALVGRLLRVLRVLRVVSVSDRLRLFMDRLKETFDEAAYASLLLLIVGYIFTIAGHYVLGDLDPVHWGRFGSSAVSVFFLMLFQRVPGYVLPALAASKASILYFLVFYFVHVALLISVVAAAVTPQQKGQK